MVSGNLVFDLHDVAYFSVTEPLVITQKNNLALFGRKMRQLFRKSGHVGLVLLGLDQEAFMTHFKRQLIAGGNNLFVAFDGSNQFIPKRFNKIGLNGEQGSRLALLPDINKEVLQAIINQFRIAAHFYTVLVQDIIVPFEQNSQGSFITLPKTIPNNIVAVGLQSQGLVGRG